MRVPDRYSVTWPSPDSLAGGGTNRLIFSDLIFSDIRFDDGCGLVASGSSVKSERYMRFQFSESKQGDVSEMSCFAHLKALKMAFVSKKLENAHFPARFD